MTRGPIQHKRGTTAMVETYNFTVSVSDGINTVQRTFK